MQMVARSKKYSKVLVTGGAGFIGSCLTGILLDEGKEVRVLDNLSMGKRENVPEDAEFVHGDVLDAAVLRPCLEGVDGVFHLAARVSIRSSIDGFFDDARTNLMGTLNLLDCIKGTGVKKLVYASSMAVYSDSPKPEPVAESYLTEPLSPYGISKLASEKYCLNLADSIGIDAICLRYFNTYGPRQTLTPYVGVITIFINNLLEGKRPVIFGDGEQMRDFIWVRDIARASALALESPVRKGVFNVGTGSGTSVNRMAELLIGKISPGIEPDHAPSQPGELRYCIADIGQARKHLKYEPEGRLEEKIEEVIEWNRKKKNLR
jgi:UDP-glucose 4-epimerase